MVLDHLLDLAVLELQSYQAGLVDRGHLVDQKVLGIHHVQVVLEALLLHSLQEILKNIVKF